MKKYQYENIKVLIPLQLASTRVKLKNIRPFYQNESLFDIKAKQLLSLKLNPKKVYVSSEDDRVKALCEKYHFNFLKRDKSLTGNAILQSNLIGFILAQIPKDNDDILWVQVTNPLFNDFKTMLDAWQDIQNKGFDSIIAVKTIRHHLINESGIALNFNFGNWHKVSQDLPKIYEILWSAFLLKRQSIELNKYHIGTKPFFMAFDKPFVDIDTEADFELASEIYAQSLNKRRGGGIDKFLNQVFHQDALLLHLYGLNFLIQNTIKQSIKRTLSPKYLLHKSLISKRNLKAQHESIHHEFLNLNSPKMLYQTLQNIYTIKQGA